MFHWTPIRFWEIRNFSLTKTSWRGKVERSWSCHLKFKVSTYVDIPVGFYVVLWKMMSINVLSWIIRTCILTSYVIQLDAMSTFHNVRTLTRTFLTSFLYSPSIGYLPNGVCSALHHTSGMCGARESQHHFLLHSAPDCEPLWNLHRRHHTVIQWSHPPRIHMRHQGGTSISVLISRHKRCGLHFMTTTLLLVLWSILFREWELLHENQIVHSQSIRADMWFYSHSSAVHSSYDKRHWIQVWYTLKYVLPVRTHWIPLVTLDTSEDAKALYIGTHTILLKDISGFDSFSKR